MRALVVEDDLTSRILLRTFLSRFGECDVAVNGIEAVDAFGLAVAQGLPYDLICMDIMMPEMDGHSALAKIRALETAAGTLWKHHVPVVMTTALDDIKQVWASYESLCDGYLTKPIDSVALREQLRTLGLVA
jgi:two-component system chemotaxis response regulator CheY